MSQKKTFHLFKEAEKLGSYDEYPIVPVDADPQLHLSRDTQPQPFFLICDGDTVFTQMSGSGSMEFQSPTIKRYPLAPGDAVYVPAGTPHRFIPTQESVVMRIKAQHPKLEGVAWYCDNCGHEIYRNVWDARLLFCQEGYLASCSDFNADESLRTCSSCGTVAASVDISWNRWQQIADELRKDGVSPAPLAVEKA